MKLIKKMIIAKNLNTQLFLIPVTSEEGFLKFVKQDKEVSELINCYEFTQDDLNHFLYSW